MGSKEDGGTETLDRDEVKIPPMYRVILHNDDFTTMEFVVWLLMDIFKHDASSASKVMLSVHNNGSGVAGTYSHEIATLKLDKAMVAAEENDYPLQLTMEPDS